MSSTRLSDLEELVWQDMLYHFPYLSPTISASIDDFGYDAVKRHINLFWRYNLMGVNWHGRS
jgi:hypothetical protein